MQRQLYFSGFQQNCSCSRTCHKIFQRQISWIKPLCFMPFFFNPHCHFTSLLYFRPFIFGVTLFCRHCSVTLTAYFWRQNHFSFTLFYECPFFSRALVGRKKGRGIWGGGPDCPGIRTTKGKSMLHKSYKNYH